MLERGSYIPWASRFRRYLNRKRENRKWLTKAIDKGPYEFRIFTLFETEAPRMQKEEDLRGDDLKHYEAEIEAMNLILISIPNDIYNSMDACTTAKAMWQRVERLMRGTLMNDLERNGIIFPKVTINTKFLNCLQPEWLKYVTQVRLAKRLTEHSYDDFFYYLQQFEKLVNASKAKKLEKSHDPLALVAHTGSSSRTTTPYYVIHPSSVVDYDDDYQGDVELSANICLMAKIQPANFDSNEVPSYDSAFLSEVQTPSTSYVNPLFAKDAQEQKYPKQPKIINNSIGDNQIDSNIIFDEPNGDVNSGSVEYDNNVQESFALEQLARNAYKEAGKQQKNCSKSSTTKHSVDYTA
ncbi:hypothetical protein Tco_1508493 [Tanacetum coccineum]